MIVLCANRLYTPREEIKDPLVFIEDGLISAVSSRAEREIPKNATVVDFTATSSPRPFWRPVLSTFTCTAARASMSCGPRRRVPRLNKFLTTHGVTGYFPTTVAAPLDQTCAALERLADAIEAAIPSDEWRRRPGSAARHPSGRSVSQPQAPRRASSGISGRAHARRSLIVYGRPRAATSA